VARPQPALPSLRSLSALAHGRDLVSAPSTFKTGNSLIIVAWIAQTFLQWVLLPIIIVGQNVLGRYPSVVRYEAWRGGRRQLPAAATARRFARSWDDLLVAAYPLVYAMRSASPTRGQRVPRRTTDAERPSSISC
jgi:hypothetical protein